MLGLTSLLLGFEGLQNEHERVELKVHHRTVHELDHQGKDGLPLSLDTYQLGLVYVQELSSYALVGRLSPGQRRGTLLVVILSQDLIGKLWILSSEGLAINVNNLGQ